MIGFFAQQESQFDDDQFYNVGNKEQTTKDLKEEIDPHHVMDDVQSNFTH